MTQWITSSSSTECRHLDCLNRHFKIHSLASQFLVGYSFKKDTWALPIAVRDITLKFHPSSFPHYVPRT
jgi:hypothetical protein